jgi:hypothetical protein
MNLKKLALAACAISSVAVSLAPANAAAVITNVNADLSAAPFTFNYMGSSFTFGFNGDYFGGGPLTISTAGGGEVNTIFGQPTTNFVDRGVVSFGPSMQYAAFASATPIRFSNGDNFIGLRAVTAGGEEFYGFAFSTNNVLNTVGFETVAGATITATIAAGAVPEPASWAMMIGGFGMLGAAARRRARTTVTYA